MPDLRGRLLAGACVATGLLAAVFACREPPRSGPQRPDILLVSLDTFRADLLEEPNAARDFPSLTRLSAESIRFTSAFAPMAFTLPSHMTLMTSLHPETHDVTTQHDTLAPEFVTLAEALRENGYRTSAVVAGSWLKSAFGFDRGFDRYVEIPNELTYADRVSPIVLRELAAPAKRDGPRFVFAHFFDAHSDWSEGGNRLTYYSPPEYRQGVDIPDTMLCDSQSRCATDYLRFADREGRALTTAELEIHHDLYRRGAMYLDEQIGSLFRSLERAGVGENILVVVVSDHGEEFREHGKLLHSQVFRESLRVPLVIRLPGAEAATEPCDRLVSLEDVAPTILDFAGLTNPSTWQGTSLLRPCGQIPSSPVQVGQDKLVRSVYALRAPDRLFLWDFASGKGTLFRTRGQGAEQVPATFEAGEQEALRGRLETEIRARRALRSPTARQRLEPFDEAERRQLESLGYLQ